MTSIQINLENSQEKYIPRKAAERLITPLACDKRKLLNVKITINSLKSSIRVPLIQEFPVKNK